MNKQIVFLGEFSSGKSAFINVLLGVSIIPESLGATNLPVVKVWTGEPEYPGGLWLREPNQGNPRPIKSWKSIPPDWNKFLYSEITIPEHPLLIQGLTLWDTPGINSTNLAHTQHLEKFLRSNLSSVSLVIFFVRDSLTKTSLDFLKKYISSFRRLLVVQNIHEIKQEAEYKKLYEANRATLSRELGQGETTLLYIGDLYETFAEISEKNKSGFTEYEVLRDWQNIRVDIHHIAARMKETLVGTELLSPGFSEKTYDKIRLDNSIVRSSVTDNEMVFVKGGTFMMGSNDGNDNEKPIHKVTVDDFYIDKYPVTVKQYREYCAAHKIRMPVTPNWGWIDDHPMVNVTWDDTIAYAKWVGKRLPTEAEWEYTARGGLKSKGFKWAGSNSIEDVAWYDKNSNYTTHSVGKKKPNELGIFDMSGNVREWCSDWCSDWYLENYYSTSPSINPKGPDSGQYRVLRGGSWGHDDGNCRVANRSGGRPDCRFNFVGFRCARTP